MSNSTMKLIDSHWSLYSPAERNVATYIKENAVDVINMTTKELASVCNSSEATIIRFCKRISVNSFKDLKIHLAREIDAVKEELDTPLQFEDDIETTLSKVTSKTVDAIYETKNLISLKDLEQSINLLHQAERIYLYGAGGSSIVVSDFSQKLLRVNQLAYYTPDIHVQMMMAANMTQQDVLFVVSTSGKTKEIVQLLTVAKEKGVKTILLTQNGKSPAQKLADIILTISPVEHNIRIGTMSARIAQLMVVDNLFIGICVKLGEKVYDRIIDTHDVVQRMNESN